jgi:hypothetical protein
MVFDCQIPRSTLQSPTESLAELQKKRWVIRKDVAER